METTPRLGLIPTMPLSAAGIRPDPAVSVPIARSQMPSATATADPELDPPEALARALSEEGYAASVREVPVGEQLCQQHCPVAHVAHEFPELCEAETEAISRMLGRHVQRLATIAHGDGVCTTCIPTGPGTQSVTPTQSTQSMQSTTQPPTRKVSR